MITHAAFPKTLLYCFIGPPRRRTLFTLFLFFLQFAHQNNADCRQRKENNTRCRRQERSSEARQIKHDIYEQIRYPMEYHRCDQRSVKLIYKSQQDTDDRCIHRLHKVAVKQPECQTGKNNSNRNLSCAGEV